METHEIRDESAVHLVVLQHGLWGRPDDVARLAAFLQAAFEAADTQQQLQDRVVVVNSTCNARVLTYDGIDVCGARLAKLVQETVEQQQQEGARVSKLSLIGYSLGGLICRYAAGKLYVAGLFEEVQPVNLITIATPHLGSFKEPTSWMARFFNSNVPIVASRSGMQLLLADADYSVPWLVHQQQLHNQAHQQYEQQHGQQQQQEAARNAARSAAGPQQHGQQQQQQQRQQQQEEVAEKQDAAAAPLTSDITNQQEQQDAAKAAASGQQQLDSSSTRQQQQQQQQQRMSLPPGVDPSRPIPLLLLMAHPVGPFHKALAAFKTRICCANIKHDTTVPYCTAAVCTANPYEQRPPVSVDPQLYPSVVQPAGDSEQGAAFPDAKGRSRLLMFLLFLPFFPLFYSYSVAKGLLHHREARKRPLDVVWLQQYRAAAEVLGAGLNPFSKQASRQLQDRLDIHHHQQQQDVGEGACGAGSSAAAAAAVTVGSAAANAMEPSPFATPAVAAAEVCSSSDRPGVVRARGLQQLLTGSSSMSRQQHVTGMHTQVASSRTAAAAVGGSCAVDQLDEDARDAALEELYPAAAAADQTEEQMLRASGSTALLLSREVSRRLTAAGSLHEHQGIVEADEESGDAWLLQQQQRWMARQLFGVMPPCVVCERRLAVQGAAVTTVSGAGRDCSSAAVAAAGEGQRVVSAAELKATSEVEQADAAVDVQVKSSGSNAGASSGDGVHNKESAAADSSSSSSVGMSKGGWHRVDVWTGHVHAHATIIVRDKRYESQSRDLFAYLVNHMSL